MIDLHLKLTARYYHFVALSGGKDVLKKDFLKAHRITENGSQKIDTNCIIYQFNYESDKQYYRPEMISNPRAKGPFNFDLLLIEQPQSGIVLLGFPFRSMTLILMSSLEKDYRVLSKSNFIKPDLLKLIRANHRRTDLYFNDNHYWLGGVFISLTGDSFLSNVKLAGDKPLDSDIYKNYFKEKLSKEGTKSGLEKCLLKSKVPLDKDVKDVTVTSTIHIDKFGNYKIYVQNKGKNLVSMPATFDFLKNLECLVQTPKNPVFHISTEEQ